MTDLRGAIRALRAAAVVTTVAIMSLALGIGANTAIFSILNSLLLRSLPVQNPQELAIVALDGVRDSWTYPIWAEVKRREGLFAGAAAWSGARFNTTAAGVADRIDGLLVSGRFFEVLGVPAVLGRMLTEQDDVRGTPAG